MKKIIVNNLAMDYFLASRMNLVSHKHRWMSHEKDEIDYILEKVPIDKAALIYDIGCGQGRHSIELGKRGYHVVGMDYVKENIDEAKRILENENILNIEFFEDDCRKYKNENKGDLCLCLYDVIGSYADDQSNRDIISRIYDLLKDGGIAVISVMNYEMTSNRAKYRFSFDENPNKLLSLMASTTMQNSGEVFNPDYDMVDEDKHVVYRREQFTNGQLMPIELVVRDRRYTMKEITGLCEEVGFKIVERKYTHASSWNDEYDGIDKKAKEILLLCIK